MVTKEQALSAQEFHCGECLCIVGKRGGKTYKQEVYRRNGQTKTWKTRPNEFSVPIKYGLKEFSYLTDGNAYNFHTPEECPLTK